MIVISHVVDSFPIPPAAAWINAAFSVLSPIILSFLQSHVCPLHAAEQGLAISECRRVQKGRQLPGERVESSKEGESTLHNSAPAHRYSQLDLELVISKAKIVRHRISK